MKSTILLALGLFLISAPAPDANDIAEMTQNFIVPEQLPGLEASEVAPGQVDAATDSRPDGEMSIAPGAGEISVRDQSAKAARSVQLIQEKIQKQSVNEG